jgi:tRNA U38,U39,U40 pseudouridine synthase TruA
VGMGRRPVEDLDALLREDTPLETSPPAPPEGLFLRAVTYPTELWGPAGPPAPADASDLP